MPTPPQEEEVPVRRWTPNTWRRYLQQAGTSDPLVTSVSCRASVMLQMLRELEQYVSLCVWSKMTPHDLRLFWEQGWLIQEGFLPPLVPAGAVTNERFGWSQQKRWHEWHLTSVKVMRFYWAEWLQGLPASLHHALRKSCANLLSWLPGPRGHCERCRWLMPASEMWNVRLCAYCHQREQYPYTKLVFLQGVPLLVTQEPAAVKHDGALLKTFQQLHIT